MPAMVIAGLVALSSSYRANLKLKEPLTAEAVSVSERETTVFPENYSELLGANEIIIKNTAFTPPGFVVVREEVSGNPSEEVIGKSELIDKSSSDFVVVTLTKAIKKDDIIYINYFIDNGDGIFDPSTDEQKTSLLGNSTYIKLIVVNNKTDDTKGVRL